MQYYGLTGCGFQFEGDHVRVMLRHKDYISMLKNKVLPLAKVLK